MVSLETEVPKRSTFSPKLLEFKIAQQSTMKVPTEHTLKKRLEEVNTHESRMKVLCQKTI